MVIASHDGLSYIFKKKTKSEFSILELSFTGFKFVKKIDVLAYLQQYVADNNMKEEYQELFEDESWINDHKRCIYTFMLNNN